MKSFKKALKTVFEHEMLKKGDRVLVALSGGPDSVYLLHFLTSLKDELSLTIFAAHINHNLRKDEAKRDEEFCKSLCDKLGVPLFVLSANVKARCEQTGEGTEEAARNIRYGYFEQLSKEDKINRVALGHNADDFAETLVFNLIRGAGAKGLMGIAAVREKFIRPLIDIPKAEIENELFENGIPFMVDCTNLTDDYTRNKIRHNIIPLIKEINPSFYTAAKRTASALREDEEYLSEEAALVKTDDVEFLNEMPPSVSYRVISEEIFEKCGFYPDYDMISRVRKLIANGKTSKSAELKNGFEARISYGKLVIGKKNKEEDGFAVILTDGENTVKNARISVDLKENTVTFNNSLINTSFKCDKIVGELVARSRKTGDRIRLNGVNRLVKKLLIDEKIPCSQRNGLIVISDSEKIFYIEQIGKSDNAR